MTSISRVAVWALLGFFSLPAPADSAWDWSERELRVLRSMSLGQLGSPPPSPGNPVADNPAAAALGKQLFFDPRLSRSGDLSCASCHRPDLDFTDGLPRAIGEGTGNRNTPTITGAAWNEWFYWDGRRDSLWAQALIPFEDENEMGGDRLSVVRTIAADAPLRTMYEALFGPMPSFDDIRAERASPINPGARENWYRLSPEQQRRVSSIFAKLGKAIAAWERTQHFRPTLFDAYVASLDSESSHDGSELLTTDAKAGARLFMDAERTQCLQCHNGPTLTNGGFHNIGTGNFDGDILDYGRAFGLQAVLLDEFNCLGPYSDADPEDCTSLRFLNRGHHIPLEGAFKTPTLRGVSRTAPYFHDGSLITLTEVVEHYNSPPSRTRVGRHELRDLSLTEREVAQLVAFMQSLSEPAPPVDADAE